MFFPPSTMTISATGKDSGLRCRRISVVHLDVLAWLEELGRKGARRIPVRLVKGAYWDTEIKHAQELGLESYPVFTRKVHTDVSYLACARQALAATDSIYPQFATHNAHTLASVMHYAGSNRDYEFQRLHGMGEELYAEVIDADKFGSAMPCLRASGQRTKTCCLTWCAACWKTAPTPRSSIVSLTSRSMSARSSADPIEAALAHDGFSRTPKIPQLPARLFGPITRTNSAGINLPDRSVTSGATRGNGSMQGARSGWTYAAPLVCAASRLSGGEELSTSVNPANTTETVIGHVGCAELQPRTWTRLSMQCRYSRKPPGIALRRSDRAHSPGAARRIFSRSTRVRSCWPCVFAKPARHCPTRLSELREAVDFLRYYAQQEARPVIFTCARRDARTDRRTQYARAYRGPRRVCLHQSVELSAGDLHGPGFRSTCSRQRRAGKTRRANAAGCLPCRRVVVRSRRAGLTFCISCPVTAQLIGGRAVADARIAGVAFTGSTETARIINQYAGEARRDR